MFHGKSESDDDDGNDNTLDDLLFWIRTCIGENDLLSIFQHDVFARLVACVLNLCILVSGPHDLKFIEAPHAWTVYILLSLAATYMYLTNCKCYDIYKFEELYQ